MRAAEKAGHIILKKGLEDLTGNGLNSRTGNAVMLHGLYRAWKKLAV